MSGPELAALGGLLVAVVNIIGIIVAVYRMGRAVERFEGIGTQQAEDIHELKEAVKGLGDILTKMALHNERLDMHAQRLGRMEAMVDDLRRGEGYILPIFPKSHPQG